MKKAIINIIRYFNKQAVKEDFRKLGINLITASAVGAFVTHLNDMTLTGWVIIGWLALVGAVLWLMGIYNKEE